MVVRGGMASPRAGLGFRAGGGGWLEGRRYGGQRGVLGGGWQGWGGKGGQGGAKKGQESAKCISKGQNKTTSILMRKSIHHATDLLIKNCKSILP